jgi:UDP-N-acetylmuramoyl-tripeptide--D-alanyl-D-alanine ligase
VQAVAEENGSVIDALPLDGVAVFPADDDYTTLWQQKAGQRKILTFGSQERGAQIWASQAHWAQAAWQVQATTPAGELSYDLHIAGAHNVKNSLAAVACALAAGVPLSAISAGLQAFEPVKGRSRALLLNFKGRELTLVDDTYNANPDSVRAAIEVLAALPGPRLLVLGDMGEVGDQGPKFHLEALQLAREKNIDKVLVTGQAFGQAALNCPWVQVCEPMAALQAAARNGLPEVTSVLVKGSRFMKMEQVVEVLQAAARQETDAC